MVSWDLGVGTHHKIEAGGFFVSVGYVSLGA